MNGLIYIKKNSCSEDVGSDTYTIDICDKEIGKLCDCKFILIMETDDVFGCIKFVRRELENIDDEIDEDDIHRDFHCLVKRFNKSLNTPPEERDPPQRVRDTFPNPSEDVGYGGSRKLVKITLKNLEPCDGEYLIRFESIQNNSIVADDNCDYDPGEFYSKLIENCIIEDGHIYDLNDEEFIKKVNSYKTQLDVITGDLKAENPGFSGDIHFNDSKGVRELFLTNTIINGYLSGNYSGECDENECYEFNRYHDIYEGDNILSFKKFGSKFYDQMAFSRLIPYKIDVNGKTEEFYIINIYDEYIGTNSKDIPYGNSETEGFRPSGGIWSRKTVFNKCHNPYEGRRFIKDFFRRYCNLTNGKQCINMTREVENLYIDLISENLRCL